MIETGFLSVDPNRIVQLADAVDGVCSAVRRAAIALGPTCSRPGPVEEAGLLTCLRCGWWHCR
jgi:hypothetical protein